MMQEIEELVGEHTYRLTQLPFREGQKLLTRLFKVLGPALAAGLQGQEMAAKLDLGSLPISQLGEAVKVFCEAATDADLEYVTDTLAKYCSVQVDGAWHKMADRGFVDLHFAGKYKQWLLWVIFGLKVNYADFFSGPGA